MFSFSRLQVFYLGSGATLVHWTMDLIMAEVMHFSSRGKILFGFTCKLSIYNL